MTKKDIINLFESEGISVFEDDLEGLANAINNLLRDAAQEREKEINDSNEFIVRALREAATYIEGQIQEAE